MKKKVVFALLLVLVTVGVFAQTKYDRRLKSITSDGNDLISAYTGRVTAVPMGTSETVKLYVKDGTVETYQFTRTDRAAGGYSVTCSNATGFGVIRGTATKVGYGTDTFWQVILNTPNGSVTVTFTYGS